MANIDDLIARPAPVPGPEQTLGGIAKLANMATPFVVGRAVQQAADPNTGQIDQNKVLGLLKGSTLGSMAAIPTMQHLQTLRQAGYAADQAGLDTFQKRMATTYHLFGQLAAKDNPTMEDVYDTAAQALDPALNAKSYGITLPVIMNAVNQFRGLTPQQIKKKALQIQTQAANTGDILHAMSPRMQWVNQGGQMTLVPMGSEIAPAPGTAVPLGLSPTTPVATPQGTHYLGAQPAVPGGGAVGPTGAPIIPEAPPAPVGGTPQPSGPAATLPPGYMEAAHGEAQAAASGANSLLAANDTSMARKAILGNLEDELQHFTSGPGADWSRVAKSFINRNFPVPPSWQAAGGVLDLKSIASQEEFNKQAAMLAQSQFQAIGGTGTDAKFNSAFTTSPNEYLSKMGNEEIIDLLKGNEDAIQVKNAEWQRWLAEGNGPQTYPQFSAEFNSHFDPRTFQFQYVAPKDRQAYIDRMDKPERQRFLYDLTYAMKHNWVNFGEQK